MNLLVIGGLLGGVAAAGLMLAVLASPPFRRTTLADRIAPYLSDTANHSRLLVASGTGTASALGRLTAPLLRDAVKVLERLAGGQTSVRRRLRSLDSDMTVEQFRAEQVLWGAMASAAGLALGLLAVFFGQSNPLSLVFLIAASAVGGVLGRDWWLSQAVAKRDADILVEFPVVAEMLALAVTAGEGPVGAIERISRLAQGHLVDQLNSILADTRSGTPLLVALTALRDRTRLEPLSRFLDGMAVAIERGTPLADVLRAQAADVRALGKRQLLESGGKKEIAMMVPVVFFRPAHHHSLRSVSGFDRHHRCCSMNRTSTRSTGETVPYRILQRLQFLVVAALMTVGDRLAAPARPGTDEDDRGDVPGWVMITVVI